MDLASLFTTYLPNLVEAATLLSLMVCLQFYKVYNPQFLFPCQDALLFDIPAALTPQDPQGTVKLISLQYGNVKGFPFSNQFNGISMTLGILVLHMPLRILMSHFTAMSFWITTMLLVVLGFYISTSAYIVLSRSPYATKVYFTGIILLHVAFFILWATAGNDYRLEIQLADYSLETGINIPTLYVIALTLLLSALFVILVGPSLLKICGWYGHLLKQLVQAEEAEQEQKSLTPNETEKDKQIKDSNFLKGLLRRINWFLGLTLVSLFFAHPATLYSVVSRHYVDMARIVVVVLSCWCVWGVIKSGVEYSCSFAYTHVKKFMQTKEAIHQRRTALYLHGIWYTAFHYTLPIFYLTWMALIWGTVKVKMIVDGVVDVVQPKCTWIGSHSLETLYRCSHGAQPLITHTVDGVFGFDSQYKWSVPLMAIGEWSQWLCWYFGCSVLLMCVAYIIIVRKSVHNI